MNDEGGGGSGWRIGEVIVLSPTDEPWGFRSIGQAEEAFHSQPVQQLSNYNRTNGINSLLKPEAEEEDEDDADYWAQYDNTPARTPAPKHSPAPPAMQRTLGDEDSYYAQYASVQPAMDNHDPDEATRNGDIESTLGKDEIAQELHQRARQFSHSTIDHDQELHNSSLAWNDDPADPAVYANGESMDDDRMEGLAHPRPGSSSGSSGSDTVEKLERRVAVKEAREQNEVGIKQHIGTSIKSLYRLAKVAGIERGEFERIVKTELECLALMDEDE